MSLISLSDIKPVNCLDLDTFAGRTPQVTVFQELASAIFKKTSFPGLNLNLDQMHDVSAIPSANIPPGQRPGFAPTFNPGPGICTIGGCRGSALYLLSSVPSCQLCCVEATLDQRFQNQNPGAPNLKSRPLSL